MLKIGGFRKPKKREEKVLNSALRYFKFDFKDCKILIRESNGKREVYLLSDDLVDFLEKSNIEFVIAGIKIGEIGKRLRLTLEGSFFVKCGKRVVLNEKAVEYAFNLQPERFEDLILVKGIGKGAVRALALIADLIYNAEYDRQDPAKYCFAVGGKDGIPFPVDRQSYDEVIEFMREAIKQAELGNFEKRAALKRLATLIS